jgi:hypothetical protein
LNILIFQSFRYSGFLALDPERYRYSGLYLPILPKRLINRRKIKDGTENNLKNELKTKLEE